jgi:hypothetical protein
MPVGVGLSFRSLEGCGVDNEVLEGYPRDLVVGQE